MDTEKQLVVPAELIPTAVAAALEPPKLPTAETLFTSAKELANAGLISLHFIAKSECNTSEDYKDFLDAAKSCRSSMRKLEEQRKGYTDPAEQYKKNAIALYGVAIDTYEQGFRIAEAKALAWKNKEDERIRLEQERIEREKVEAERRVEAERLAREAAEQLKQAEEEAHLENAQRKLDDVAEAEGEGTAGHQAEAARLQAEQARIESERAEREFIQKKADAEAQADLDKQKREAVAAQSTLSFNKPKGTKKVWKAEIVNEALVVRKFCKPDQAKINAAAKAGFLVDENGKPTADAAGLRVFEDVSLTGRGASR